MDLLRKTRLEENLEPYLTQKLLSQLIRGFRIGQTFASHPYKYNEKAQRFERVHGAKLWLWYFNAAFTAAHYSFLMYRFIESGRSEASVESQVVMQFLISNYTLPVVYYLVYTTVGKEIAVLANGLIKFFQGFSPIGRTMYYQKKEKLRETSNAQILIDTVFYWFPSTVPNFIVLNLMLPQIPAFLSSVLLNSGSKYRVLWMIISAAVASYQICICVTGTILLLSLLATVTATLLPVLTHLRLAQDNAHRWNLDIRTFIQVKLLAESTDRCFSAFLAMAEVLCIAQSVYGVFAAVRLSGVFRLGLVSVGLMCYLAINVVLRCMAEYYNRSNELLSRWRRSNYIGWNRRSLRALQPIKIHLFGSFIERPSF